MDSISRNISKSNISLITCTNHNKARSVDMKCRYIDNILHKINQGKNLKTPIKLQKQFISTEGSQFNSPNSKPKPRLFLNRLHSQEFSQENNNTKPVTLLPLTLPSSPQNLKTEKLTRKYTPVMFPLPMKHIPVSPKTSIIQKKLRIINSLCVVQMKQNVNSWNSVLGKVYAGYSWINRNKDKCKTGRKAIKVFEHDLQQLTKTMSNDKQFKFVQY